jgi:hypothetical protein|uniref:Uncharacterized protein n=1 Tax=viral metagenome TaxID=1070528 RepID=A0A6C0CX01_9ZZZZ
MPISKFKSFLKNNFPISSYLFRNKNQILNLGRWGVECDKGKGIIADNANVDHCGPCGTTDVKKKYEEIDRNIQLYKNRKKSI